MSSSANSERPSSIAASSAASSDNMSPWQSLHVDLVQLIGLRVLAGDLLDYVRFRAVCTQWRSSVICPRGRGVVDPRFHPRRWMLLPEGHGLHPSDGKKSFFNLSTGAFVRARLLLSRDCCILDSVDGLLLVQWGTQDADMIRLVHPFTGDYVELPPVMSLVRTHLNMSDATRRQQWVDFKSVTSPSVNASGVTTVMIMINHTSRVFFASNKVHQWSVSTWSIPHYSTSLAFQGKFYMLVSPTIHGGEQQILQLNPPHHGYDAMLPSLLPPRVIGTCPMEKIHGQFTIAQCGSEILVIGFDAKTKSANRMLVYRVRDIVRGEVVPITSIGSNVLFLDIDNEISIDNDFVHVRKSMATSYNAISEIADNSIVRPRRNKNNTPWHYNLCSGKWTLTPTFWCNDGRRECNCGLIYHIYGCCHCADLRVSKLS